LTDLPFASLCYRLWPAPLPSWLFRYNSIVCWPRHIDIYLGINFQSYESI
jgi:hypothetical protein